MEEHTTKLKPYNGYILYKDYSTVLGSKKHLYSNYIAYKNDTFVAENNNLKNLKKILDNMETI